MFIHLDFTIHRLQIGFMHCKFMGRGENSCFKGLKWAGTNYFALCCSDGDSFCTLLWPSGKVKGQHDDPSVAAGGAPDGLLPGAHAGGTGHRPAHLVSISFFICLAPWVTFDPVTGALVTGICRDWRPIRKSTPGWCSASGNSRPCWTPGVLATLAAWKSTNSLN